MKNIIITMIFTLTILLSLNGPVKQANEIYNSGFTLLGKNTVADTTDKTFHTVEEVKPAGVRKIIIRKDSDGKVLTEDILKLDGRKNVVVKDPNGVVLTENEMGADY